jgi:hypothetical protein
MVGVELLVSITGVETMPSNCRTVAIKGTGWPPEPQSSYQSALPALPGGLVVLPVNPCLLQSRFPAPVPSAFQAKTVPLRVTAITMLQGWQVPYIGLETVMPVT